MDEPEPVQVPGPEFALPPEKEGFELGEPKAPPPEMPGEVKEYLAGAILYVIDIVHDDAADSTGYEPFRLTLKEKEMWNYVLMEVVPRLPLKYAILLVTVVALSIAEGRKVAGYVSFRARQREATKGVSP